MNYSTGSLTDFLTQATQQRQQEALYPLQQRQAAIQVQAGQAALQNAQEEQAAKRRSMAVSLLSGALQEPDPAKRQALIQKLAPMAQRYDTTLQLDNPDETTIRALMYSQIPAAKQLEQQVELEKAQMQGEYRDALLGIRERALDEKQKAQPKPPSGYIFGPADEAGKPTLIPLRGGPADPALKPMTESQSNAATYAARLEEADPIISTLGTTAGTSPKQRFLSEIPAIGNYLVSSDFQQTEQAERDFLNAVLRKESGAAIGAKEFDSGVKQYFPRPGDNKAVLAQKAQNRLTAIEGMKNAAGPSYKTKSASKPATGGWSIKRLD